MWGDIDGIHVSIYTSTMDPIVAIFQWSPHWNPFCGWGFRHPETELLVAKFPASVRPAARSGMSSSILSAVQYV